MSTRVYVRQLRCFAFGLLFLVACASAHSAIPMKATVGFDGTVRSCVWTPVAVELVNPTDENLEGTLDVALPDSPHTLAATCSARVDLPAHSKKLFHSYARISNYGGAVLVVFRSGRAILAQCKLAANPASRDDWLVVSVGSRAEALHFLNNTNLPPRPRVNYQGGYGQRTQGTVYAGSIASDKLPDRPQAYDGVDILVLSDLVPASTNPRALSAIAMWVASGGTLVIPTGADYRRFRNDFYDDLLPVRLVGTANLNGLPSLSVKRYAFPAGPVTVAKGAIKPEIGRVLTSESGVPIVAERSYGAGRVVYLAVDPRTRPFRDWDGQVDFWKSMLQITTASDPLAIATLGRVDESVFQGRYNYDPNWASQTGGMLPVIAQNPAVRAPSFNSVGLFLVSYLILLAPVNYFILRRRKRLELAWVTTPAVVLLFTVGAYAIGCTMKGSELRLQEVTIIEGSGSARYAHLVTDACLFSPARRSYDLRLSDPGSIAQAVPVRGNEPMPQGLVDETCAISDVRMAMWSSRMFESVSGADLGGTITSSLTLEDGRLLGTLANGTRIPLTDCMLCYAGRRQWIGDLPVGGSAKVDSASSPVRKRPHVMRGKPELAVRLRDYAANLTLTAGCPVLVGRPASFGPVFTVAGKSPSQESAALCLFRLDCRVEGTFDLGAGGVSSDVIRSDSSNVSNCGRGGGGRSNPVRAELWGGGRCVISFRLALPAGVAVSSLTLRAKGSPPDGLNHIEIAARNQTTQKWSGLSVPPGGKRLNPAEFLSAANEVRVRAIYTGASNQEVSLSISAEGHRSGGHPELVEGPAIREATKVLTIENLTKTYGKLTAVDSLNLRLEPGDIMGFIGPNGAGKTTTIKMVATLLMPDSGTAYINGVDVIANPEAVRPLIGYMPDFFGLYDDVLVWEYLDFFASAYRIPAPKRKGLIDDVLELTDLTIKRESLVSELSRGMQQRLCLAKTLVHDPKLLLLDEPASGLDPRARIDIKELLKELRKMGKTILISSHILPELADFCNKIAIIEQGKLVVSGDVETIMNQCRGGIVLTINLADRLEEAVAFLETLPLCCDIKCDNGLIGAKFTGEPGEEHAVLTALTDRGFKVRAFNQAEIDLEDVFMRVTRGAVA